MLAPPHMAIEVLDACCPCVRRWSAARSSSLSSGLGLVEHGRVSSKDSCTLSPRHLERLSSEFSAAFHWSNMRVA